MGPTAAVAASAQRQETRTSLHARAPRVDIYETDTTYVILADVPGVGPDGLEIVVERDSLSIRGHVEPRPDPDYREFELSDYYRAFTLTDDLDPDEVAATLRDGVLRVEIQRSPRVQPKRIPVRTA
jgi:HSP20 family molecular chaperone IbpA